MLGAIIFILIVLWFLGYINLQGLAIPDFPLFILNNHTITLWEFLIFLVVLWAIEALPGPLRIILGIILLLWVLSTLGILALTGLPNILIIAIIVAIGLSILGVL